MTKNPFGFIRYPGSSHLFISGCWTGYVTALDYELSRSLADFDRDPTKRLSVLFYVKLELGRFVLTCWTDCLSRSSVKSISLSSSKSVDHSCSIQVWRVRWVLLITDMLYGLFYSSCLEPRSVLVIQTMFHYSLRVGEY